jgi:hypothetical protein
MSYKFSVGQLVLIDTNGCDHGKIGRIISRRHAVIKRKYSPFYSRESNMYSVVIDDHTDDLLEEHNLERYVEPFKSEVQCGSVRSGS